MPSRYTKTAAIPADFDFESASYVRAQALKYDIWFENCSNASATVTMHPSWSDDNLLALPDQPCHSNSTQCRLPPPRAGVRCALAALSKSAPDMTLEKPGLTAGEVPETFAQTRAAWDIRDSDSDSDASGSDSLLLNSQDDGGYDSDSTVSTEALSPGQLEVALDWEWDSDSEDSEDQVSVLFDDTDCIHVLPSLGTGDEDWEHDFDEVIHSLPTPRAENAPRYSHIRRDDVLEESDDEYDDVVEYMTLSSLR